MYIIVNLRRFTLSSFIGCSTVELASFPCSGLLLDRVIYTLHRFNPELVVGIFIAPRRNDLIAAERYPEGRSLTDRAIRSARRHTEPFESAVATFLIRNRGGYHGYGTTVAWNSNNSDSRRVFADSILVTRFSVSTYILLHSCKIAGYADRRLGGT